MESKCDGCGKIVDSSELRVSKVSDESYKFVCWSSETPETCRTPGKPILIKYLFSWSELTALRSYLEGEITGEILEHVDEFKANVDEEMLHILRRVIKKDDSKIQESDS